MRGRNFTIGILLVEMANPFLPGLVGAINSVLLGAKYKSLIGVGEAQLKMETSLIDSMIDLHMDGLILVGPRLAGKMLDRFAAQLPIVAIGHHEANSTTIDTVNSDDVAGERLAVQALIDAGHTKIHVISLPLRSNSDTDVYRQREFGYMPTMKAAGLEREMKVQSP